jgi:hypothetical protein
LFEVSDETVDDYKSVLVDGIKYEMLYVHYKRPIQRDCRRQFAVAGKMALTGKAVVLMK